MSVCFFHDVKNEDELLSLFNQGRWDKEIYDYLIDILVTTKEEKEYMVLPYDPVELFEMEAYLIEKNELLKLIFWDVQNSGIQDGWKFIMDKKKSEVLDLLVDRISEKYQSLLRLIK